MRNFTKNMTIVAAALVVAAGVAEAQTINAEVPFGFRAAGTVMPAVQGTAEIEEFGGTAPQGPQGARRRRFLVRRVRRTMRAIATLRGRYGDSKEKFSDYLCGSVAGTVRCAGLPGSGFEPGCGEPCRPMDGATGVPRLQHRSACLPTDVA